MIRIKSDKIIVGENLFSGYVYIDNGVIFDVTDKEMPFETEYDYTGNFVSPGFIETHTHGGGGYPFLSSSVDSVINACDFHLTHGATSIVPTVSTDSFTAMKQAVENISKAKKSGKSKAKILGAHLEGPYLSDKQTGAQSGGNVKRPVEEEYVGLIDEFNGDIFRWTYAPEQDTDAKFCKYLSSRGIVVSAGHTDAVFDDMKKAVESGCNLVTHLYSCTSTITRNQGFRSLGVIESAYLLDDLFVEIIADGKHLPPELIKMIVKIKGADKVILTTDSLEIVGSSVLSGVMSGVEYDVEDGVCKLKDRSGFAGSIATCNSLIKTLVFECGYSVPFAVQMITETPAKLFNLNAGSFAKGKDADVVVFDDKIDVLSVFVSGKKAI